MKVLKIIFLTACFLTVSQTITAQKIGVRAGLNVSRITNGNTDPKTSFYAGVFKEFAVVPLIFFIQPEVQYSSQGYKVKTGFGAGGGDVTLNYINVPVMAKVYVLKLLSLEAGPQFGFKINESYPSGVTGKAETFDPAIAAGIGLNFPLGLGINARYVKGFNNAVKNQPGMTEVIQLGASLKI